MRDVLFLFIVFVLSCSCTTEKVDEIKLSGLCCDYFENRSELIIETPKLSWIINSQERNQNKQLTGFWFQVVKIF